MTFDFTNNELSKAFAWAGIRLSKFEKRNLNEKCKKELLLGHVTFTCACCSRFFPREKATLEHIIPLSRGGTYESWNLTLTCEKCNVKRGNKHDFWLWRIKRHADVKKKPVKLVFWSP